MYFMESGCEEKSSIAFGKWKEDSRGIDLQPLNVDSVSPFLHIEKTKFRPIAGVRSPDCSVISILDADSNQIGRYMQISYKQEDSVEVPVTFDDQGRAVICGQKSGWVTLLPLRSLNGAPLKLFLEHPFVLNIQLQLPPAFTAYPNSSWMKEEAGIRLYKKEGNLYWGEVPLYELQTPMR